MKGLVLVAFLSFFTACATMPVSVETQGESKLAEAKKQFCEMGERHGAGMRDEAMKMFAGMDVSVKQASCELLMPSMGRSMFLVSASLQGQVIVQMELITIVANLGDGWKIVREDPIYIIDNAREKFHWFVQPPVASKPNIEL